MDEIEWAMMCDDEGGDEGVPVDGIIVRETEKAVLFERAEGGQSWLPKSLIRSAPDGLVIATWLAIQRGWAEDDGDISFDITRDHGLSDDPHTGYEDGKL